MKHLPVLLFAIIFSTNVYGQSFFDFIDQVNEAPDSVKQDLVDSLISAHSNFPLTEDSSAVFIYTGSGSNPAIAGDFTGWSPSLSMSKLGGTNLWWKAEVFDRAARLDYKVVYNDGSVWILDPRNSYEAPGGFGNNSELRMPDYEPPSEIEFNQNIEHGIVSDTLFYSTNLDNNRRIRVYTPPGYEESEESYPVVLVHDGYEYITFANMPTVLDNMIANGELDPLIAVFVPPITAERFDEYAGERQGLFTSFIIEEVMPWVDAKFRTLESPDKRLVMGSSNGGNISLWIGMNHPEEFGIIGAFSPYAEPDVRERFNGEKIDVRVYMNHGIYDHLQAIHESVEAMVPILENKEYDFVYEEYPSSHSYGFWRGHIDDVLKFSFPKQNTINTDEEIDIPEQAQLYQNYPNPFNPGTSIPYTIAELSSVRLMVYNVLGQQMSELVNRTQEAGNYHSYFDASSLPTGIYFYSLEVESRRTGEGSFSATRKMLLVK